MVYFADSQLWLHQSALLLEACPTTAKISTRYTFKSTAESASRKLKANRGPRSTGTLQTNSSAPAPSRAQLVLKTYDPVSGICLKYQTHKAAELGRLIAGLGRCAKAMASLPMEDVMEEGATGEECSAELPAVKDLRPVSSKLGVGGKKKKGKR